MGKTGTADKIGENGKYDLDHAVAIFVGNFEHNGTEYAILVMLDDPKASKETYGFNTAGWNAVPVAGEIVAKIVK
jgi:cell division protein FtsI (penicillin-binding protein 3)